MRRSTWKIRVSFFVVFALVIISQPFAQFLFAKSLPLNQQKNGRSMLSAFRPVVAKTRASIVQIKNAKGVIALGTIVDANGFIVTKASQLTDYIVCQLSDGRILQPKIIGINKKQDVALLKVSATNLPAIKWKSDITLKRGQWLATPGTKKSPIAIGVVSVEQRAIPERSGVLGIQITQDERGPKISLVFPRSSAERAGLKVGDVVTAIAGNEVKSREQLISFVRKRHTGDLLTLQILRGKNVLVINATLGEAPLQMMGRGAKQNRMGGALSSRRAGFPQVVQHDTILKPEECGGIVVNLSGDAVGLNIARAGRTESYVIPAKIMIDIIAKLRSVKKKTSSSFRSVSDGPLAPPLPQK
ncbi:hypothetical protein MNBD_PLANCTO02-465 [hydrothermal vent metagenome]|uniref:PDZ domain-containing protein n=1 Tax=hydrothermal vent metagenome TaxID=652676 RepID=A0A3B1D2Q3_9ZZZZ